MRGKGIMVVGLPIAALFAGLLFLSAMTVRENEAQELWKQAHAIESFAQIDRARVGDRLSVITGSD